MKLAPLLPQSDGLLQYAPHILPLEGLGQTQVHGVMIAVSPARIPPRHQHDHRGDYES